MNIILFVLFLQERVELVAEAGLPIMITGKNNCIYICDQTNGTIRFISTNTYTVR